MNFSQLVESPVSYAGEIAIASSIQQINTSCILVACQIPVKITKE